MTTSQPSSHDFRPGHKAGFCPVQVRDLPNLRKTAVDLGFHLPSVCDVSHVLAVSRGHSADMAAPDGRSVVNGCGLTGGGAQGTQGGPRVGGERQRRPRSRGASRGRHPNCRDAHARHTAASAREPGVARCWRTTAPHPGQSVHPWKWSARDQLKPGSPPRARGAPLQGGPLRGRSRITPACVGST